MFTAKTIYPFINEKSTKQMDTILYTYMYALLNLLAFVWTHYSAHFHTSML